MNLNFTSFLKYYYKKEKNFLKICFLAGETEMSHSVSRFRTAPSWLSLMPGSASIWLGMNQQLRMPPRTRQFHRLILGSFLIVAGLLPATPGTVCCPTDPAEECTVFIPIPLQKFSGSFWFDWLGHSLGRPTDHIHWLGENRVLIGLLRVIYGVLVRVSFTQSTWPKIREKRSSPEVKSEWLPGIKTPTKTQKWPWAWLLIHTAVTWETLLKVEVVWEWGRLEAGVGMRVEVLGFWAVMWQSQFRCWE